MQLTSCARYLVYSLPCLALASACERRGFTLSDDVPISNGASFSGGGVSTGGAAPTAGGAQRDPCTLHGGNSEPPTFTAQTVSYLLPARKELYALVNDAEAKALRAGAPLIPPTASAPASSTLNAILQSVYTSASEQRRKLGEVLLARFGSFRSTWPNPWALRLVGHPASEHMNPLRIVLRDEALLVRVALGSPQVVDVNNGNVPLDVAIAQPDRIAAVYYQLDSSQPVSGIADRCDNGMREIAISSEAMVEEWSLGTKTILERQNADLALLQSLFEVSRSCTGFEPGSTFRATTVCDTWRSFSASTEYLAYQWSLATPVEAYKPTPQNLASLIQGLQDDRLDPDPFVVEPAPPAGLAGGGGEGGSAGESGAGEGGQAGAR